MTATNYPMYSLYSMYDIFTIIYSTYMRVIFGENVGYHELRLRHHKCDEHQM